MQSIHNKLGDRYLLLRSFIIFVLCMVVTACQNLSIDTNSGNGSGVFSKSGNNVPALGPNSAVGESHCANYPTSYLVTSGATSTTYSTTLTVDATSGKAYWVLSYLASGSIATTTYTYDSVKAFVQERHVPGAIRNSNTTISQSGLTASLNTVYSYDALGRIVQIVNNGSPSDNEVISGYDSSNRMVTSIFSRTFSSNTCSNIGVSYQYSVSGDLTTVTKIYSITNSVGTGTYVGTPCSGGVPSTSTSYYYTYNIPLISSSSVSNISLSQFCY